MEAPQTARKSGCSDSTTGRVRLFGRIVIAAAFAWSMEDSVRAAESADSQAENSGFVQLAAQEATAQPAPTPEPYDSSVPNEGNVPAELPAAGPSTDTAVHLFHTTVPATKMKIRRDPSADRFLGNNKNAKSIRDVANELKVDEQKNPYEHTGTMRLPEGWSPDLPYGKYLYIHHAPLLFEDVPAERYGEVSHPHLQPVIGFTKFMATVPLLPYKVTTDYYAAYHNDGWYAYDHQGNLRPGILEGSFFPSWEVIQAYPEANLVGALAQGGATAGIFFLLP